MSDDSARIRGFLEADGVKPDPSRLTPAINGIYDLLGFSSTDGDERKTARIRANELDAISASAGAVSSELAQHPDRWLRNEGEDAVVSTEAINFDGEPIRIDELLKRDKLTPNDVPAKHTALGFIRHSGLGRSEAWTLIYELIAEWVLLRYQWECMNDPESYAVETTKFEHSPDALIADCVEPKRWWHSEDVPPVKTVRANVLHGGVLALWNDEEWDEGDSARSVSDVIGLFADIHDEAEAAANAIRGA